MCISSDRSEHECRHNRNGHMRTQLQCASRSPVHHISSKEIHLGEACWVRRLTLPSSGRFPAGCARFLPPLMSNVRPPRRHMSHRHAPARLPSTSGAVAESALGCPSAGGQRTIGLSHQVLTQSAARASESRMAQGSVQRLEGCHPMVARLLVGAFTFASHRRPNPAIELTASSGLRPLPASAHVKR